MISFESIHSRLVGMDDPDILRDRLEAACARRDREPQFSPDWDAAMDEIEDLTTRLARNEDDTAVA
jgi:hypothetical protein